MERKIQRSKQKWFLMRFLGNDKEINIHTNKPEFLEWKWIDLEKITDVVVDFKRGLQNTPKKNKRYY